VTSGFPRCRLSPVSGLLPSMHHSDQPSMQLRGALALLLSAALSANAAESYVVPADEAVAGTTQAEWSRLWWQWAGSFEASESPVADRTGELCASKQHGDIWFLAGTYGTRRTIRTCTVPHGKHLFFPLINFVVAPAAGGSTNCMSVMTSAARMTEGVSNLVLEIDGVRQADLTKHRQPSRGCFDLGALAEPKRRVFPSAGDGYYIMLRPLPAGTHTLNFGGVLPTMLQAVTYTLIVE